MSAFVEAVWLLRWVLLSIGFLVATACTLELVTKHHKGGAGIALRAYFNLCK